MSLQSLSIILSSVSLTALAQLALKLASARYAGSGDTALLSSLIAQAANPWTIAGMIAYAASLALWMLALREVPLSLAYPFMGLALVFVALLSALVLGETIGVGQLVGMLMVCSGLVLIVRS